MEKMLFSGVQSNSEVALIAIKGIKNQPGIAAKVFGAIAEEKINVELILQSIGRGENKDISFVVAQDEADHAVETLKKAFDEADYEDIISDKEDASVFGKSAEWKEDHSCSGNEWKRFCMRLSGCDAQGRRKKHRIVYFTASGENE